MYVRRKSNWYIYFIAFGITFAFVLMAVFMFKWYLFPSDTETAGNNKNTGNTVSNFKPTSEHSFIVLTMVSESENDSPELFCMVEYNAPENKVTFVPIPKEISVASEGRTLPNVYVAKGGAGVAQSISDETGVNCGLYIKMDRSGFESLLTSFGNVEYSFPKTTIVKDGDNQKVFNSGRHVLSSDEIYQLVVKAEYDEGESYRFKIAGEIFSELINQNYQNIGSTLLDSYFNKISTTMETNIAEIVYNKYRQALLYTISYGVSPAEFYVPYGEYTEDGGFKMSENSIISIKQKAGV